MGLAVWLDRQMSEVNNVHVATSTTFGLVWFVGFYGISTFVGYLMPNPFLCK